MKLVDNHSYDFIYIAERFAFSGSLCDGAEGAQCRAEGMVAIFIGFNDDFKGVGFHIPGRLRFYCSARGAATLTITLVRRILRIVNVLIGIVCIVAAIVFYWVFYRPLPKTSGSLITLVTQQVEV